MSNQDSYPCSIPPAGVQSMHHITCPCPVCKPSVLPISSQYTNPSANTMSVHYTPQRCLTKYNLSSPFPVSAPYCLPMSSCQCTISTDHVLYIHHLTCSRSRPLNTPSLSCSYPVSTPWYQSLSNQYTASSAHF